jgi:RimJ/RimL family protein N-acetyltransferase
MPDSDVEYMCGIIDSLLEDDECEYALSHSHGCLLVRVFDDRYSFIYPIAVCEEADERIAAELIRKYAVREEIPLVYTDVPREGLSNLISLFRHVNVDCADDCGESFTVRAVSEASLFDEMPEVKLDGVILNSLTEADDYDYARLCKDKDTNVFWGYDYESDEKNPADSYFREMAENEFLRGVAMSFAVRVDGIFAGEADLYAFDLIGGCQCGVRILPEYRGRGIASATLRALKEIAKEMGLLNLSATVDERNEISKKLFNNHFDFCQSSQGILKYYTKL